MAEFRAIEVAPVKGKEITLRPVRPNLGIQAEYRRMMRKMVEEMHCSIVYWIEAKYRNNEPLIAMDAAPDEGREMAEAMLIFSTANEGGKIDMALDDGLPANVLQKAIRAMSRRWLKRFDEAAPRLAKFFSLATHKRTDAALRKILRDGGFSVKFTMSRPMRDVVNATTAANVSLIKSIPQKYLSDVEGMVMRSIQTGRDLGELSKGLQESFSVTKRRADLIAKDQNNKATAAMNRARQTELGITTAKWRHSGGGKEPRPTHVAMNNKIYNVSEGMYDSDEKKFVFPGELINCRCLSVSVIPGFE